MRGAVLSQAIAEFALDRAVVALLVHIDEVDDDQARESRKRSCLRLPRRFEIGLERGILDVMFAGRTAGIDGRSKPALRSG